MRDRVNKQLAWDTSKVSANDIERFIFNDPRYKAQDARKVATNLNHLYRIGRLGDLATDKLERWWVDSLFLAMDRLIEDRLIARRQTEDEEYPSLLDRSGFQEIAGKRTLEKDLAARHLIHLYVACGSQYRFSEEAVLARTKMTLADVEQWASPNDEGQRGAVHPSNPRILKSIPAACAMLATYAGFDVIPSLAMEDFDPEAFVLERTRRALKHLRSQGVKPTMTAEEVLRLTRER